MSGEIETIGDAATGGLVARAVEPQAGGKGGGHGGACLNCGTGMRGDYCHRCGQQVHLHRTLTAFWHDLAHGVLHFEGKVFRTLPLLVWRPGDLTRRYVAGERARFVSPLALFLFSVFLMFAVIGWAGGPVELTDKRTGLELDKSLDQGIATSDREVAKLERQRAATIAAGASPTAIDANLRDARDEASMLRLMKERGVAEAGLMRASDDLPNAPRWIADAYRKAKANPSLLIYKLQNNAYKYSWALIPLSVPFMWLLFPFSHRFRIYDHAVFVTYSLCFMTLLVVALSLVRVMGVESLVGPAFTIVPPIHMYRQLRGTYRLNWWSALLRTIVLLAFCFLTSPLFLLRLVALGVLG